MIELPNFAIGSVTLTAILYPQPAVDIRPARRLPKNTDRIRTITFKNEGRSLCQSLAMLSGNASGLKNSDGRSRKSAEGQYIYPF